MATNVKKVKKKPVKKNYNSKLPLYVGIGLGALVLIIAVVYVIVFASTNYVAKLGGEKIYNYEYTFFLTSVMGDMQSDALEDGTLSSSATEEDYDAFWTEERKKEAADKAMEETVEYKTQYLLAKDAGFDLTNEEKQNVKNNIDYMISYYYNYYNSYYKQMGIENAYSYQDIVKMMCGSISLTEYKKIEIKRTITEKFRQSFIDTYTATDEELRAAYDKDPNAYRTVSARILYLTFGTAPTEPTTSLPKRADGTEVKEDDEDAADYQEALDAYKTAWESYNRLKDEYDAKVLAIKERAKLIVETLNEKGTYSELQKDEDGNVIKDAEGNDTYLYNEVTFQELIKAESALSDASTNEGLITFNNSTSFSDTNVKNYVLAYQWDSDRTGIVNTYKTDFTVEDTEEEAADEAGENAEETAEESDEDTSADADIKGKKPTDIVPILTKSGIYLTRCEDIKDFDNSVESSEGAADSVKDKVKSDMFDERATEELDTRTKAAGYER